MACKLGSLRITEVSATPHRVRRTPKLIARSDPEYYKLGVQLRGRCLITQDDREAALAPGDFTIYDTSRTYEMTFDGPYRQLVLMLPRQQLCLPDNRIREITARRVLGDHGVGALLSVFLRQLAGQLLSIMSYIERHLAEPNLNPSRIAAAHYISTRYLHKLFHEESTTVAGWVRERRLEHCRHDLRDPLLPTAR